MVKDKIEFNEFLAKSDLSSSVSSIEQAKHQALKRLTAIGFPSKRNEDWKYFNFQDILDNQFAFTDKSGSLDASELNKLIERYSFPETLDNLLVTINGCYAKELSNYNFDNEQIQIINFHDQAELNANPELQSIVNNHFKNNPQTQDQYFKLANTILAKSGFLLAVKAGYKGSKPLQILHISNQESFNQIRSLIHLSKDSELDIIVTYVGLQDSKYFTNAVIEAELEDNAKLKLDRIQNESQSSICLYDFHASLSEGSNFEFNSFNFGALSSREKIYVDINGENARASVNGLYVLNQDRKSHHQVAINHKAAHSYSEQLFKGLLQDRSRAEFNGSIDVGLNAKQTNAKQLNKNILLSKYAHVDSRPQLNILTDDVKCSHGATVGRLNDEEYFYLRSRGLSEADAKVVLTYSFSQELVECIKYDSVRNYAANLVFASLESEDVNFDEQILAMLANNSKFKQARYQ